MAEPLSPADAARVERLVATFARIGEERMKDLALFNPALRVEAVGFRRWDGWLAGILVTPWFMNFLLLPGQDDRLGDAAVGTRQRIEMPRGEVVFTVGEVEDIGTYAATSLHSPMGSFPDQATAATTAWAAVESFFREPGAGPSAECSFGWPEHAR